jgi:pyruvate/2-oxoglutarate dehydrogenase complex dihydrolipoamide acyltransferase (E2) component
MAATAERSAAAHTGEVKGKMPLRPRQDAGATRASMTNPMTVIVPKSGGVTSTKATVVRWLKREGDRVQLGDPLVELETEKISYELESPAAGTLLKVLAFETAEVPVGEPLCQIGDKPNSLYGPEKAKAKKSGRNPR